MAINLLIHSINNTAISETAISSPNKKSKGKNKFWLQIADDATPKKWSFFLAKKSDQYPILIKFIKDLKVKGIITKSIQFLDRLKLRLDNAGENKKFVEMLKKEDLVVNVEYTPVDGPEFNGVVERAFSTK